MQRQPEPELMDEYEQAKAYAEANFQEVNESFIKGFIERFSNSDIKGPVLDLGCGPADISVRFASVFPESIIYAVDGSRWMLYFAKQVLENTESSIRNRVNLIKALIPNDPLPIKDAVAIISNSLLHHLHEPMSLWHTVRKYSRHGTKVYIMDLIRPETPEKAWEIVQTYSADEPEILKRDFFNSLCAAFTVKEVQQQLKEASLSLQVETVSDRHLLVWGTIK